MIIGNLSAAASHQPFVGRCLSVGSGQNPGMNAPLVFATLGPAGTNHQYVTERYLAFHGLDARIELVPDFDVALDLLLSGRADHIVQCAAHPATATTTARHFRDVFVIDAFVARSRPMGVLTRVGVDRPETLALQPATRAYVDTRRWATVVEKPSIVEVGEDLLAGRADSGVAALELAERHPETLRVDERIGAMNDGWLVYGREPAAGDLIVWPASPAARLYRRERLADEAG